MSENTDTANAGDNANTEGSGFTPITSQEDFDKAISARIQRERNKFSDYDDLKAKASQFDQVQDESKSETERLQDQLNKLQNEHEKDKLENARLSAIAAERIPSDYHALVQGDSAESFATSAKKVRELLDKTEAQNGVSYKVNLDGDGSDQLALNGSGLEDALKEKLGIA